MNIMTGIIRFRSLAEAIRQGYQVYDKTPTGYLLRIMTGQGWAMAVCELESKSAAKLSSSTSVEFKDT